LPDWTKITLYGWLAKADPPIDLNERIEFTSFKSGQDFRFRLRANPSVTRNGRRFGLFSQAEQMKWFSRKGDQHGFSFPGISSEMAPVWISQEKMLNGRQHNGNGIRVYSVLYDGILTVADPQKFSRTLQSGIGHGKAMGLGLLSVVPINHD
jgi:CRISPR system Cascade subunit CasE